MVVLWDGAEIKKKVAQVQNIVEKFCDQQCQDAVEGRARFARPNIPRPSKAIGE